MSSSRWVFSHKFRRIRVPRSELYDCGSYTGIRVANFHIHTTHTNENEHLFGLENEFSDDDDNIGAQWTRAMVVEFAHKKLTYVIRCIRWLWKRPLCVMVVHDDDDDYTQLRWLLLYLCNIFSLRYVWFSL